KVFRINRDLVSLIRIERRNQDQAVAICLAHQAVLVLHSDVGSSRIHDSKGIIDPIPEENVAIGERYRSIDLARYAIVVAALLHPSRYLSDWCPVARGRQAIRALAFLIMNAPAVASFLDPLGFHHVASTGYALRVVLNVGAGRDVVA